jgi:hypothetical protein
MEGLIGSPLETAFAIWMGWPGRHSCAQLHRGLTEKTTHWGHPVIVKDGVHHRCLLASPRTAHADKEKQKSNVQGQHEVH